MIWLDVPGRLAKTLLALAARHGQASPKEVRIELRLTQEELAQMVGAARQTVTAQMSWLRERGIVDMDRQGITLHQLEQLRKRIY